MFNYILFLYINYFKTTSASILASGEYEKVNGMLTINLRYFQSCYEQENYFSLTFTKKKKLTKNTILEIRKYDEFLKLL